MTDRHEYVVDLSWSGSTGEGYEHYARTYEMSTGGALGPFSADPAFGGDAALANPEQLLVMAAVSCQLLSFLAVAARSRVDVITYVDRAVGVMPPQSEGPMWVTTITLSPQITVRGDVPEAKLHRMVEIGHRECFIANSLRTQIELQPEFRRSPHGLSL
ncbi:OsmC family protein [Branchiibius sp. NY16-3462-2]|uniref:OsmC family protein n=1 Tax=Branchiibius sp. NY16-3462-2 TaxID=1807500 RepID=UPI000793BE92|nr:OsmC family protein [Branchiibius sp. NY16-3462-2]KYH44245.1 osmotically inducible protein OsmC [Branchiibius sp. NY16-3462-2]